MTVWVGIVALGLGLASSLFMPVPQNLKTSFEAGQSLYALGEYEGAIQEYSKIVHFKSRVVRSDSVRVRFGDDLELPVVAAAWYQLGNAHKRNEAHDEAIVAYQHVLEVPGVSEDLRSLVQYQVAETRFFQEQYEEAAEEYQKYVQLFPDSPDAGRAFFYSGWSDFNRREYDQAIATLEEMLVQYPQDRYAPDAHFRIASALYEKEEYLEAIDRIDAILERYPNNAVIGQATYLKANAFDKIGMHEESIAAYREVRGLYDRMFELLRGSFREGRNVDFDNYRRLFETSSLRVAEILIEDGNYDDALQELIQAQETVEDRFYTARVQMRIGDLFMRKGRVDPTAWNDAWTAYNQVIALYSDTAYPPNAQYQKGEARYFAGDYEAAREEYLQVLTDYPDSETSLRAASLYSAGWSAERLGDTESALANYNQVVRSFPRSEQAPLCLLRIARVEFERQRIPEAIEAFRMVTENYAQTRHVADAYYGLGIIYRDEKRFDESIASFSRVGREAGQIYIASLTEAANILLTQDRPDEGRELLNQLLLGVVGDPALEAGAHFQIAQLDLNNRNYVEAIERYTKVIDEYPDSEVRGDARYGRALANHHLGYYRRALADHDILLDSRLPDTMRLRVQFSAALSYAADNNEEEARRLLSEVIASGDETLVGSARLQLISMAERQDPRQAISIYEEMLEGITEDEDRERVLIRLASAYFRLNQFQQSIEAAQQLIDLAVNIESIANALFVQGNSYFRAGEFTQAISTYQRIIDDYPQVGWARNALFQIGISYNQLSSRGHLEVLPAMSEAFEKYYTQYPDDDNAVIAYYYDAWARYRLGHWNEASEVFNQLAVNYPGSRYAAEAIFRAGDALFNMTTRGVADRQQKYIDAMVFYDRVVEQYPNSDYVDDALYNKAWCLINIERQDEAIAIFEEIVERFPHGRYGPRSQFTLGDYYYGLREYEKATASYQRFLELFPPEMLAGKEFDPQDRGLPRKAEVLLGHLAEIDAYQLYSQGEKLFDEKRYAQAIEIFLEVQQRYPESDQAVNAVVNIGAAYMVQEEYRRAGVVFQEIVDKYDAAPRFSAQVDFARQQLEVMREARVL